MSKYEPLRKFLTSATQSEIPMTFAEIEKVIGDRLPPSQRIRAWWSNNPTNNVMTKEWLAAGFKTEQVDIEGRKLIFRRVGGRPPAPTDGGNTPSLGSRRHPGFGLMKGLTTIAPGTDLTAPTGEEWERSR